MDELDYQAVMQAAAEVCGHRLIAEWQAGFDGHTADLPLPGQLPAGFSRMPGAVLREPGCYVCGKIGRLCCPVHGPYKLHVTPRKLRLLADGF